MHTTHHNRPLTGYAALNTTYAPTITEGTISPLAARAASCGSGVHTLFNTAKTVRVCAWCPDKAERDAEIKAAGMVPNHYVCHPCGRELLNFSTQH